MCICTAVEKETFSRLAVTPARPVPGNRILCSSGGRNGSHTGYRVCQFPSRTRRCTDDVHRVVDKLVLDFSLTGLTRPAWVGKGIVSAFAELRRKVFGLLFTQAVYDTGLIFVLPDIVDQGHQGIFFGITR